MPRWTAGTPADTDPAAEPVDLRPVLEVIFTTLLVAVLVLAGGFALLTLYKLFSGQS